MHLWATMVIVHTKFNEIKLDNRLENLYLTTTTEHAAIHREGKKASVENRQKKSQMAKERTANNQRTKTGQFLKEK